MRIQDAVEEHHGYRVGRIAQLGPMQAHSVDGGLFVGAGGKVSEILVEDLRQR